MENVTFGWAGRATGKAAQTGEISWAMTNSGADEQLTAQIPQNRRISVYRQEIMA
jgi:hypothetical protein